MMGYFSQSLDTFPELLMDPRYVYEDKSLCLYYPPEHPWRCGKSSLYSHKWILFYEIWKITGTWEHPEVNHGGTNKV